MRQNGIIFSNTARFLILAIRTIVWNENPLLAVSVDRDDKMSFYSMPRGHGVEVDDTPFRRRCSC